MPVLTAAQAHELERLRARAREIRAQLIELADIDPAVARPEDARRADELRREFTRTLDRIQRLEAIEGAAKRAAMQSRDAALAEVAELQERAARRIAAVYRGAAEELAAIYARTPGALLGALKRTLEGAALIRNKEIRDAMVRVARAAELLNHEVAVRTFGTEVTGDAAGALGLVFGGGLPREVVDDLWGTIGNSRSTKRGIAWLLDVADKAETRELQGKLRELVSLGANSRTQFKRLREAGMPSAELPQWVSRLGQEARMATRGSPSALEEYRNLQRQARTYIAQRKGGPLGTRGGGERLLQRLEKAVRETDEAAIDRALSAWIERKTAYNGVLAMRTATNKTYDGVNTELWKKQPWVYACRWVLASNHPRIDVCNAAASFDLGRGPGVYPIGKAPEDHPNGICRLEPVVDDDFLDAGTVPVGWRAPDDMAAITGAFSFDGSFAKAARGAKDLGELEKAMQGAGWGPRSPIDLVRGAGVGPDNLM